MPIQVLPPQLANQIAAGEVVERPASVVKELVENSLDAGATRIDIDIEKAGARMIRIRDDGCGIGKDELALALARHATSKIASLDDLEAIISLGFRGEALASISSVSRLTLTSRTEAQSEGWQAYAEGRDMDVTLKPAAHPVGSTVEVLDLFYNTPARRKFMRTEKTEFAHIDEVVKRIALARFDVTFNLSHNGKPVRQYRAVTQESQHLRRLGSLCGPAFVQRALAVSWAHGDLAIRGWVADPRGGDLPEMQYCYVNNRMMRDKLINHAIRQAYQEQLADGQLPAFVLYLDVDPHQVDVNVHPAKHEVRFHQARLVHDFIYQAIISVLSQSAASSLPLTDEGQTAQAWSPQNRLASGKNAFTTGEQTPPAYRLGAGYQKKEGELYRRLIQPGASMEKDTPVTPKPSTLREGAPLSNQPFTLSAGRPLTDRPFALGMDRQGTTPLPAMGAGRQAAAQPAPAEASEAGDAPSFGRVLSIYGACYALVEFRQRLALMALPMAEQCLRQRQLTPAGEGLKAQPLLIPLRLTLNDAEAAACQRHQPLLNELGIQLQVHQQQAILNGVPLPLRQQNLQNLIPNLLGYLSGKEEISSESVAGWIAGQLGNEPHEWSLSQAIQLLAEVERLCPEWVKRPPAELLVMLDLDAAVKALTHE